MSAAPTARQEAPVTESLRWQIMEVQVQNHCGWADACNFISARLDEKRFEKVVKAEV